MSDQSSKNILLVDDDPLIIRMYQNKLTQDGYMVRTAFTGKDALAEVMQQLPDLIFLDVMMPEMNGVETLKRLKADPRTKAIPVIILTNLGDREEDIDNAKALGALDYLVKAQTDLKELSTKVRQILGIS